MVDPATITNEHITELNRLVAEYSFYLTDIPTRLTVKIWWTDREYGTDRYTYTASHRVHTPVQATPYRPSGPFAANEEMAIRKAISDFTTFYSSALSEGHQPSEKWLVPSSTF
jgi:hypothetical protein